jgi:hypothetical protein
VPWADLRRGAVAGHEPVLGTPHVERHRRLEVRLVEAREPPRRRVEERHRVQVRAAVGRVDVPVQAFAVVRVGHLGVDDQLVVGREPLEGDPPGERVEAGVRVDGRAVEGERAQSLRCGVQERRRIGGAEADRRRRAEGLLATIQIEHDPVAVDGDRRGAALRVVAGEARHRSDRSRPDGRAKHGWRLTEISTAESALRFAFRRSAPRDRAPADTR